MEPVTKNLTWQQLDITTITNLYLYGQMTTPRNKVDESLIRTPDIRDSKDNVINPQVVVNITNVDDFMKNGPGRFANASQFGLISSFMNGGVVNTVGEYDISTIAPKEPNAEGKLEYPDSRKFSVQQYNYTDSNNDSATRIYTYGSTSFVIRSGTLVVSANGDRYIKDLVIAPFEDNFDFESNQGEILGNISVRYLLLTKICYDH